jgi:large subunit ribosomal protein L10e
MGDTDNDYDATVTLIASRAVDIRSRALEAARVTANRNLLRLLGDRAYFLQIVPYPHEVIREHKFMGFAGADRLSQGMKLAFGRPTGRAARVTQDQAVLQVSVNQTDIPAAKTALARASKKLPMKYRITITEHNTSHTQES